MQQPENRNFRWNCETLFCVEKYLEQASDTEQAQFYALARSKRIGLSGSYLNFTDLVDSKILRNRLLSWAERFAARQCAPILMAFPWGSAMHCLMPASPSFI